MDQRFGLEKRLRNSDDFRAVYDARQTARDDHLLLFGLRNQNGATRLGLSVSRKVGNAVTRNRWKRLLREAFRLAYGDLPAGYDLVIVPRGPAPPSLIEAIGSLVRLTADLDRRARRRALPPHRGS